VSTFAVAATGVPKPGRVDQGLLGSPPRQPLPSLSVTGDLQRVPVVVAQTADRLALIVTNSRVHLTAEVRRLR
jgi:hypothetical protein